MTRAARGVLKHTLIWFGVVFVSIAIFGCSKKDPGTADLDAINTLHQRDMEASKKWDIDTLVTLWTDDIVTLSEGGPPMIGKDANRAAMLRMRDENRDVQISDYILSFNEVKIVGDWAFEWGTYSGTVTPVAEGESVRSTGKVIRVLKKEADGSWKIARAMYNTDDQAG